MRGVVALERDEPEARIFRTRHLRGEKRPRADAVVFPSVLHETPQRLHAVRPESVVLRPRAAAGLHHEVRPFEAPVAVVRRREHLHLVFGRDGEHRRDRNCGAALVLVDDRLEGLFDLAWKRSRLGHRLGCERPERRNRLVRAGDGFHADSILLRRLRRAPPGDDEPAASDKLPCPPDVASIESLVDAR